MIVQQLINKLQTYDNDLDIKVIAENGLHLSPEIKMVLKDKYDALNHSKDNTDYLVITW